MAVLVQLVHDYAPQALARQTAGVDGCAADPDFSQSLAVVLEGLGVQLFFVACHIVSARPSSEAVVASVCSLPAETRATRVSVNMTMMLMRDRIMQAGEW